MRTKVGEHSGCCLWLGFEQAGTEEAAQLPAACGRLPSELLEMHLGLGREEKSKLPQICRHKSNKRNGGRAVSEVWLVPPLGGCVLKTAPCRLCCARSCRSGHPGYLQGHQKDRDVVGAAGMAVAGRLRLTSSQSQLDCGGSSGHLYTCAWTSLTEEVHGPWGVQT